MFANRNGFFYTLDRVTGKVIVARPFVETTWAKEIGPDGRPVLLPGHLPDEVRREARELRARGGSQRSGVAAEVHDRRDDPDAEELTGSADGLERSQFVRRDHALTRFPDDRDPDRVEAGGLRELHLGQGDRRVGVPSLVLGGAHVHAVTSKRVCRHDQGSQGTGERDEGSKL